MHYIQVCVFTTATVSAWAENSFALDCTLHRERQNPQLNTELHLVTDNCVYGMCVYQLHSPRNSLSVLVTEQ